MPIGLGFLDASLRYRHVNDALAGFNGLPVEAHVGRTPGELLAPELASEVESLLREALLSGEPRSGIRLYGRMSAAERQARSWEVGIQPVRSSGDEPLGVTVVVLGLFFADREPVHDAVYACLERLARRLGDAVGTSRAHSERQAASREFRALVEHMPDIVTRFDRDGRHQYVNPAVLRATGMAPERFIGRTNRELGMPEPLVEQWERRIEAVFQGVPEVYDEFSFETPEGRRHYQWRLVPEFGDDGRVRHALGVTTDITELKSAQEALLEREVGMQRTMRELDVVYRSAPAAFCVIDREQRFVRVNERLAKALRETPESLVGCSIDEFRDAMPSGLERLLGVVFEDGRAVLDERLSGAAGADPAWRCWSVSVQPLTATHEDDQPVTAVSCMFEEVTRRVLTEKRLAARAAVARVLAVAKDPDAMPGDVAESMTRVCDCECIEYWRFGPGGDDPGEVRLLVGEPAPVQTSEPGRTAREAARSDKARWLREVGRDDVARGFALPMGRTERSADALVIRMHERMRFDAEFIQTMDDIASDIREWRRRLRAEQDVRDARQQAEAANAAKSEFLANISHELRSPLTAILGYAELLEREVREEGPRRRVMTVRRNGEHLLELLNDLLDLAKMEAGKLTVEPVPTDIERLISDVRTLMNVRAAEKGLDLRVDFDGRIPQAIVTDPLRLRQILINLVGNAIKFTERGSVTMRTSFVDGEDPVLRVEVVDTGVGLSHEQQAHLFSAFTQADATSARRFGGTGLGLAISRRLAQLLGGDIDLNSRQGHGSTFSVMIRAGGTSDLPRAEGRAHTEPEAMPSGPRGESIQAHVLVVDDTADLRELVRGFLEAAGASVSTAAGAYEAGRIIDAALNANAGGDPIDAVILDMQMPEVDGFELTRRLREAGFDRPIVALTASAMVGERERCLAAGCTDYVSKPVDSTRLVDLLGRLLTNDRADRGAAVPGAISVLVVEDNDDARELTGMMLESRGLRVHEAANGRLALAAMREARPDVVLLDISLPDIDGREVARRIRADEAGGGRPGIVAMSGYAADRLDLSDFDRHVLKPASIDVLLEIIGGLTGRN